MTLWYGAPYARSMEELSKSLFVARSKRGLTQEQAARQADISVRQWSAYETGQRKPHAPNLGKLERWLEGGQK